MWGKVLPGFTGYFRRKAAMHPSVCALRRIHLPLQGRLYRRQPPKASPARGGVAPGDGGVRHLAVPIPFRGDLRRRTGSRRAKSPALHRARWRAAAQERRPTVPGSASRLPCIVGRAFTPAGEPCDIARFPGRCQHRPLRMRGQGPAGVCRIFPSPTGNAPLRLHLAAHPPPLAGEASQTASAHKKAPGRRFAAPRCKKWEKEKGGQSLV